MLGAAGVVRQFTRQFGHIRQCLGKRVVQHRAPHRQRFGRLRQHHRRRLHGRHLVQAQGQPKAAFRLGAHVPPQAVPPHPAGRQFRQRAGRAADEFKLDFVHRQLVFASKDVAHVVGNLDHRAGMPHAAVQALNVGAVQRGQNATVGQGRVQQVAGRRAGMAAGLQRGGAALRRQCHFMFHALHQAVATALQRLHPRTALFAQPQRQAGSGQAAVGRVRVHRLQACGAYPRGGHVAAQTGAPVWGNLKLQFDFHGIARR